MSIHERYDELKVYRHTSCKDEQRILCLAMVEAGIKARRPGSGRGYLFESLRLKWAFRYGRRGRDVDFILRIYALFLWRKNIPGFIVERGRTSVKQIKSRIGQMLGRGSA